ncbi:MAG: hypothetical protein ABIT01_08580 [Thermoanaerobaculia bacterium]
MKLRGYKMERRSLFRISFAGSVLLISAALAHRASAQAIPQNFDVVVAPALPAGWTAANASGVAPLWVTSTTTPDTAPNDAFIDDPASVSDKRLDSPAFIPGGASPTFSFRHQFALESNFDGGVIEISVNGGVFTDIITAGGTLTGQGYNGTIDAISGNPIAGRSAFTGTSPGFPAYVTTNVNIPATAQGKSVVVRWRMGSDLSAAGIGWRIDTISALTPVELIKFSSD